MDLKFWKKSETPTASATPEVFGAIVQDLSGELVLPEAATQLRHGDPNPGTRLNHIGPNNAGVRVNHVSAAQVAAVWACMDVIAASLAASDWIVYEGVPGSEKNKVALVEDALHYLLNTRPNPEMTSLSFKRALLLCAVGMGNGYAEIEWDRVGRPVALWPIFTDRVEARRDLDTGQLFYRVAQTELGGFVDMDPIDIIHIRGAGLTGVCGDDPVARGVQSIAGAIALDQFTGSFFANGTHVGGILNSANKLDDPAYERLVDQWNRRHLGAKNANKTAVLDGGVVTYEPFVVDASKSQMVESRNQQIEEIARLFRVPPHKIGHLLRATNNNIEHQGLEFTRDTLRPWAMEIGQELSYRLIPWRVRKFVEVDLDWASQGDYNSRVTALQILRNIGAMSANDVLRKLGENTIGAEGDIRIVQGAMIKLEDVGKAYAAAATTETTTPAAVPEDESAAPPEQE